MNHDFKKLPVVVQLGAPTGPMTCQASSVACEAGIVAIDGVASDFSRHSTRCAVQMIVDSSDIMSSSHHYDGGSIFSKKIAIAVVQSGTVPEGARVALGR